MSHEKRTEQFTMRLNDEEHERLHRLAAYNGINAAQLIRVLLKREEDAIERDKAGAKASAEVTRILGSKVDA
jgi:predicted DNA-binding protein